MRIKIANTFFFSFLFASHIFGFKCRFYFETWKKNHSTWIQTIYCFFEMRNPVCWIQPTFQSTFMSLCDENEQNFVRYWVFITWTCKNDFRLFWFCILVDFCPAEASFCIFSHHALPSIASVSPRAAESVCMKRWRHKEQKKV